MTTLTTSRDYDTLTLTPLRKVIAGRMTNTIQTIPHARIGRDIHIDNLLKEYTRLKAQRPSCKLSINDFIVKACAITLAEIPKFNIQFVDGEIHRYSDINISIVVSVKGGLSTPVIFGANRMTIWEISEDIKRLSNLAKTGGLKAKDLANGTFSISNLGMYGVDQFDAIINAPQGSILAVGFARPQPIVKDGELSIGTIMKVTLSMDHRIFDGGDGAHFLTCLKRLLENPADLLNESKSD